MKETAVQQSLHQHVDAARFIHVLGHVIAAWLQVRDVRCCFEYLCYIEQIEIDPDFMRHRRQMKAAIGGAACRGNNPGSVLKSFRSEEHTSELQSLMRISYAVFCLKKKKRKQDITH